MTPWSSTQRCKLIRENRLNIVRITTFVGEVKKTNRRVPFLYAFTPLMFYSSFSLSFPLFSPPSLSPSRELPHSRLPLQPAQPLPTIRRAITFRSTTYPLPARFTVALSCFPSENLHRLSAGESPRVRKAFSCELDMSSVNR